MHVRVNRHAGRETGRQEGTRVEIRITFVQLAQYYSREILVTVYTLINSRQLCRRLYVKTELSGEMCWRTLFATVSVPFLACLFLSLFTVLGIDLMC